MLFVTVYVPVQSVSAAEAQSADSAGVYVFQDAKKEGTVTVIKKWEDDRTNDERPVPDITISTERPEGAITGYRVTFHGNGLTFADGTTENEVVYTQNGQVLHGQYKIPEGTGVCWYTDASCRNRVAVSNDGILDTELTGDIDLYAKEATFVLQNGDSFNQLIPEDATAVYFTDEVMPENAGLIDVDDDGDGGVAAWMDGSVMKVSTQVNGVSAVANQNCKNMFSKKTKLTEICFNCIDTSGMTNMQSMFLGCSCLQELDLSVFNTTKVVYMNSAFANCNQLKKVNIKSFDTSSVKNMQQMFYDCNKLTKLNMSSFDTHNVTNMNKMWYNCRSLTRLDLSNFDTSGVTGMDCAFYACHGMNTLVLGEKFAFVGNTYSIPLSKWKNSKGEVFDSDGTVSNIPDNAADVYSKL